MRSRIVGLTVLVAFLATALFAIPLATAVARYFISDERDELARTADTAAVAVSGDLGPALDSVPLPSNASDMALTIYSNAGLRLRGHGPDQAPSLVERALGGNEAAGNLNGHYASAAPVTSGDAVQGAVLATIGHRETYRRIVLAWLAMAGLAGVTITLSWLIARRLARRLIRPLEEIEAAADRLGQGDFTVRTQRSGISELDSVGQSLDMTASRLDALVERERAFATDLSHQMRTPLTGLRLVLEAGLETPNVDPRRALHDALAAADRLEATVSDLLALARETPNYRQSLDVTRMLEDIRERWLGLFAAENRPLWILCESKQQQMRLSHACARQIVDVLIDNACTHGAGAVTVRLRDASGGLAVDVSDEGAGIATDRADIFARRSPAAANHGIGLALARSLAEAEGARLILAQRNPTTFTLLAPAMSDETETNAAAASSACAEPVP